MPPGARTQKCAHPQRCRRDGTACPETTRECILHHFCWQAPKGYPLFQQRTCHPSKRSGHLSSGRPNQSFQRDCPPMSRGGGQQAACKQKLSQIYTMYFQKSFNIVNITHLGMHLWLPWWYCRRSWLTPWCPNWIQLETSRQSSCSQGDPRFHPRGETLCSSAHCCWLMLRFFASFGNGMICSGVGPEGLMRLCSHSVVGARLCLKLVALTRLCTSSLSSVDWVKDSRWATRSDTVQIFSGLPWTQRQFHLSELVTSQEYLVNRQENVAYDDSGATSCDDDLERSL